MSEIEKTEEEPVVPQEAPALAPSAPGAMAVMEAPAAGGDDDDDDDDQAAAAPRGEKRAGRRKINIEFIEDKSRRHITFSKRKAGIMKKAYELSALTGTQVLLLVASETGHVYTYATEKLQPLIQKPEGKNLIQTCLSAPDPQPQQQLEANGASQQYANAMAAAAASAQAAAAAAERPAKQRKVGDMVPGGSAPGAYGMPGGMAGLNPYAARGMPSASMGIPALAAQGGRAGPGGLPFGMDPRALAGLTGQLPGMPAGLQGLSPALLQGLMSGQLPPGMMNMDGLGGMKLDALQQTIADATNAGGMFAP